MNRTAYAMLAFNPKTQRVLGWIVTSSPDVTVSGSTRWAQIAVGHGDDYAQARDSVVGFVRQWCPDLGDPCR